MSFSGPVLSRVSRSLKKKSRCLQQGSGWPQEWSSHTRFALGGNHNQKRHFAKGESDDPKPLKKQAKGKKKQSGGGPPGDISSENRGYKLVLAALNAPITKPPPASPEEMERRFHVGRNYVIGSFQEHNQQEHMISCKISLKNHAIAMLPRNSENPIIRKAAMVTDEEGPPPWRLIPTWTPPIEGFNPSKYQDDGDD